MNYSRHLLRHIRCNIGNNIHRLRMERKLPLRKLSHLSNVPEITLDNYEIGKGEIRLEELLKIACALSVETGQLLMNIHR